MKYLNGYYHIKVRDKRFNIHPTEDITIRKREPSKSLRTQYQEQKKTKLEKSGKVEKVNEELELKPYNSKQKAKTNIVKNQKFILQGCPSCKRNTWVNFDQGFCSKVRENVIDKQKHQSIKCTWTKS